jgi:hypothetical protein
MVQKERFWDNLPPEEIWTPRDTWFPFDPFLLAEGKRTPEPGLKNIMFRNVQSPT